MWLVTCSNICVFLRDSLNWCCVCFEGETYPYVIFPTLRTVLSLKLYLCCVGVLSPDNEDATQRLEEKADGEISRRRGAGLRRSGKVRCWLTHGGCHVVSAEPHGISWERCCLPLAGLCLGRSAPQRWPPASSLECCAPARQRRHSWSGQTWSSPLTSFLKS